MIEAIYTTSQSLTHFFFILSNNIRSTDIFYATIMPINSSRIIHIYLGVQCAPPPDQSRPPSKGNCGFLRNIDTYLAQNPIIVAISL